MANYKATLACGNYDRTIAVIRGLVKLKGVDLRVVEMNDVVNMFTGVFKGKYDAGEMSLAELIYYTSRGECEFIGIPVFPSRVFRHGDIFCNTLSNIKHPRDLEGMKVGFPRYTQTASIWIRGMLLEEYKISPSKLTWYIASVHHWDNGGATEEIRTHDGSLVHHLETKGKGAYEALELALTNREIDALGTTGPPKAFIRGEKTIRRLFNHPMEEETSYFRKTKIFPIMHVLVVRKSVVEKHPDLPVNLFHLFAQGKKWGQEWVKKPPSLSLVWKNRYIGKEEDIFQGDPWAYGLRRNNHVVEKFLSYCYDLGVSDRKMSPNELFVPNTWDLED